MSHVPYATPGDDGVLPQDRSHLTTLAIFWYILAGLCSLGALLFLLAMLLVFGTSAAAATGGGQNTQAPAAGLAVGFFFLLAILTCYAVLIFFGFRTAIGLQKRKYRTTCFVMACIACLGVPLGTILGIFTLVVLNRPSVQDAFARNQMQ